MEGELIQRIGSIEFDGNGMLRGCISRGVDQLLTIDTSTGEAIYSGVPLGFACTGLALVCE